MYGKNVLLSFKCIYGTYHVSSCLTFWLTVQMDQDPMTSVKNARSSIHSVSLRCLSLWSARTAWTPWFHPKVTEKWHTPIPCLVIRSLCVVTGHRAQLKVPPIGRLLVNGAVVRQTFWQVYVNIALSNEACMSACHGRSPVSSLRLQLFQWYLALHEEPLHCM